MKRYEALVILHNPTKEDGIKEAIDLLTAEVSAHEGKIDTVQKMDRKPFSRTHSKKTTSGFYVNVIFEAPPAKISHLRLRLAGLEEVYRVMIAEAAPAAAAVAAAAAEAVPAS